MICKQHARLGAGTILSLLLCSLTQSVQAQSKYTVVDLGSLGGTDSTAQNLNASGQAIGYAYIAGDVAPHAFRTTANSPIKPSDDIGTLGGSFSTATAVNSSGQVIGWAATTGDMGTHAFRTAANSSIKPLDDLGTFGGTISAALGINATGQVVGYAYRTGDA